MDDLTARHSDAVPTNMREAMQRWGQDFLEVAMMPVELPALTGYVWLIQQQGLDAEAMYNRARGDRPWVPTYEEIVARLNQSKKEQHRRR